MPHALQCECEFSYRSGFGLRLSLAVDAGITALVGPSGCGKTTTLHLVAGILQPSSGRIVLGERVLFDSRTGVDLPIHRRRVGLVFQDYQLFPHLTVEGNLLYGANRSAGPRSDLSHLIDVLQLGPLLRRRPATLSGGQRQRVALGRALASAPKILLLDEPVSALDDALKSSIVDLLQRTLLEFPVPTLFVTHDLATAERVSSAIVRLPCDAPAPPDAGSISATP